MKKFFGSAQTLFLLLLLSKTLPVTATMGKINLEVEVYNKKESNEKEKNTYEKFLKLNYTKMDSFKISVDLTNDKNYIKEVLKVLNNEYPNHHFLFPWGEDGTIFELPALAASSFPITKQCSEDLWIYAVKKDLLNEELTTDPVTFFEKPENWESDWAESEGDSTATSTVSKNEGGLPFTTTSDRAGTDSHTDRENHTNTDNNSNKASRTGKKEQKKGGTLLKYGGALLLISILTGGCYALYQSFTSQKGRGSEQEEEEGSLPS